MTTELEKKFALTMAQDFIKYTNQDIKDITRRFFVIGFRLNEAKEQGYVEALGYPDIETLAEEEFGFKRSTTYGLIAVFRRFAEVNDNYTRMNYIKKEYADYSYSQLLEINKLTYLPPSYQIKEEIPPTSSVRDIASYVKYRKERQGGYSYSLPKWKEQQKIISMPTLKPTQEPENQEALQERAREQAHKAGIPFYEGEIDENFNPYVYDGNMSVEDYKLMHQHMEEDRAVQTSGLQDSAKPANEESTQKKEKTTYNFATRAGVRTFLADYENWKKYSKSWNSVFFKNVYGYTFKNGKYIMACERTVFEGADFDIDITVVEPVYYLSSSYGMIEISKNQFEQYCAEYKNEL